MRTSTRSALDRVAAQRDVADTLDGGSATPPPWTTPDTDLRRWDPVPATRGHRVLVAAVTAAVVLGGAGVVVATHRGAPDAAVPATELPTTTTTAPATTLAGLAAAAAAQPAPDGTLPYSYVHTATWTTGPFRLNGQNVDQDRTVRADHQRWVTDDGAGRDLSVAPGGDPAGTFEDTLGGAASTSDPVPAPLPQSTAQLLAQHPGNTGADWVEQVDGAWSSQAVDPTTQSSLLTILDGRSDVTVGGEVLDRAGRTGISVSAVDTTLKEGIPLQLTLVLDPDTGALLGTQRELLSDPPVIDYTLYLVSGRTADTTTELPQPEPELTGPAPALVCPSGETNGFAASLATGATGTPLPQEAADDRVLADTTDGAPYQWRTVAVPSAGKRTLTNGTVQLDVARQADGTWLVVGGTRCG